MKRLCIRLTATLAAALVLQLLAPQAVAQFRAGIQGVVLDANGARVPEATVTLVSLETNATRTTSTSGEGVYSITGLAPGHYQLTIEKTGFQKKTLADVLVRAEQMQSVDVDLQVGQTTETVTVEAQVVPLLDTETALIGGTITDKEIDNLPSFSRDPYQLMRLAPGVFGDGSLSKGGGTNTLPGFNKAGPSATDSIFNVENGVQITANGTRQNSNSYQVDGVGVNSTAWGGAAVITPNEESVKEVRVIANNYTAEYGRNSGAQVMVVSQNGTNELHGSAFFKWHRPGLNAYQAWNGPGTPTPVAKDTNRFNQYGGSLGGPLWKNKLFAFFSYETLRNNSWSVSNAWFETPQFLQNAGPSNSIARQLLSYPGASPVFTQQITRTCADVGLPSTQCRDAGGGLDLGSPMTSPLGTKDPTYGQPGTPYGIGSGFDGIPDVMYVQSTSPNNNTSNQYNGRVDYNVTQKDAIAFGIYWVPLDSSFYNGPARQMNFFNHSSLAQSWTGIYTHTFSPTLINEGKFGYSGWDWNEFTSNPQVPWGLPTDNIWSIGGIGTANFGAPGYSIFNQKTWVIRDVLTKVHGSHSIKMGADVSRSKFLDSAPWSARPTYDFRNLWEFANDSAQHENANFDPKTGVPTAAEKNLRFHVIGLFVQDDWKLRPNLTVNLGLRWEYFSPLTETDGHISNPLLGTGDAVLTGIKMKQGGDLFGTSKNNWGPQVGIAWSPQAMKNKLVLRGGGGIGYNLQQLAITSNGRFNPPWVVGLDLYGSDILYSTSSDIHSYTGWPSNPVAIQQFDPATGIPTTGAPITLNGFPDFMPSTVTYRYSFDGQYDIGHNWVATLGYQGSQSRHYTIQNNLNYLFPTLRNPRIQNIFWFSNDANAHYNAMLAQVQHRFSNTFEIDTQYRYSKNTDIGSQDYFMDMYPWNLANALGPSDFDVTHSLKIWGIWTPKIFRGGANWMEKVLGGWTISGIVSAHSGFPWTPNYCNTAGNVVYPNSGFGCLYPASYSGGAGSNFDNSTFQTPNGNFPKGALSYFTVPTWPTVGIPPAPASSVSRNMFRGPRYFGNDFTLAKAFGLPKMKILGEGAKLNLQANFYNLFNKLNLQNPNTTISYDGSTSNPQFGQSQGALAGRIIELQARFSF